MVIQEGDIIDKWIDETFSELAAEVSFVVDILDAKITIKPGFRWDGASVPRFFWRIVGAPMNGKYVPAALLHDALYAAELFPRAKCDAAFLEFMAQLGVAWWRRNAMWLAVRIGGGAVWRQHTARSVAAARRLVVVS
jgi:hypothetical protein